MGDQELVRAVALGDGYVTMEAEVYTDPDLIRKMDLNTITFKQLIAHPYFPFEVTKAVMLYRKEHKRFTTPDELKKIKAILELAREKGVDEKWNPDSKWAAADGPYPWPKLLVQNLDKEDISVKVVNHLPELPKSLSLVIDLDELYTVINEL